jgi:hypothetical protein
MASIPDSTGCGRTVVDSLLLPPTPGSGRCSGSPGPRLILDKESSMRLVVAVLAFAGVAVAFPDPHSPSTMEGASLHAPDAIVWKEGPPSLPKGAKIAVLEGDPSKPGPFVFRVKIPDGYRVPPHVHPKMERITVLAGTFNIGMGDKFDESKTRPMPTGTYGYWPAGMKHFVWAKGETILQFHGEGPWSITYVNSADDPRNAKR